MAKKKNEGVCPECEMELDEDGNCPSCGWTKGDADQAKEDPSEATEDDDWDTEGEDAESEEEI